MDQKQQNLLAIALVIVVVALAWWQAWPLDKSIRKGLDLQGGLSVILTAKGTAKSPVTPDAMDRAELIVRNRVDRLGASEASVQRQGNDSILVQLPGIKDPQDALKTLKSTGQLEIRDVVGTTVTPDPELGAILLTGDVITSAKIVTDPQQPGQLQISVTFNKAGAKKWADITTARVGKQIAIVLDGKTESAPTVNEPILSGDTLISGSFTPAEAKRLKTVLETGALPVTLVFSESRVVGPTLGQDSLKQGLVAALVGLGLVALYMAIYYRGLGVLTWFSLGIFSSIYLGILATISQFGAFALSLPGLAGMVLTVGLAADSSILILERFKEEVGMGRTPRTAAKSGTRHAIGTSVDADLVTFVSALVLYSVAIGPVKGFAFTLMLGIVCDLTVAILFTRTALIMLAETVVNRYPVLFGLKGGGAGA
ncbi:MAG: protein translocase subunit SecD [Coriobacteriia bacterium]